MTIDFAGIRNAIPDTENPDVDKIAAYGALAFLYLRSETHRDVSLRRARQSIQPPLDLGYFHIFNDVNKVPRAAVTWAFLSADAEARLIAGEVLAPRDWRSGPNMWVIDIVAPFGRRSGAAAMQWLRQSVPSAIKEVKYLRLGPDGGVGRVVSCTRQDNGRAVAHLVRAVSE